MEIVCAACGRSLEYSGEPPRFCGYCGKSLTPSQAHDDATLDRQQQTHDQAAPPAPREPRPAQLGGYRLRGELGRGGMGVVFEAEQIETGRRVALKLLPQRVHGSPQAVERFLREGRLAASLSHPRSTFIYSAGEAEGQFFITMELMPGGTVKDVVDREGPLPVGRAVDFALDALDGLEAAHAAGVIHRDVKPSNCFLDGDGRVKVGDYGLSKSLGVQADLTRTGAFLGTPLFAAPEQIRGEEVDPRTDIYALGATLFFLLTGRGPFAGDAAQVIAKISSDPPPRLRSLRPELPRELERIVARTLEKDPARRFDTVDALRRALAPFGTQGASLADLGRRLAAFFLDVALIGAVGAIAGAVLLAMLTVSSGNGHPWVEPYAATFSALLAAAISFAYFACCEGWFGQGLGKRLLGLCVVGRDGTAPGWGRAALRAALVPGLPQALGSLAPVKLNDAILSGIGAVHAGASPVLTMLVNEVVAVGGWGVALVCLATMRRANGYRGLHELLSGTRTVSLRPTESLWRGTPIPVTIPLVPAAAAPADETLAADDTDGNRAARRRCRSSDRSAPPACWEPAARRRCGSAAIARSTGRPGST